MDNILDVCQIAVEQGGFSLKNISFSVQKRYITGLIGRNGSGKTTLINAICNAVELKSGTIKMLGRDSVLQEVLNKQELGIVMEELSYFDKHFSIWENAGMLAPLYRDWDDEILDYYLKKYGIITGKETNLEKYGDVKRPVAAYSKGEQVRIRLAFALAHKPRLLLLDEPTANLDPVFRRELLEDLQELIDCPVWLKEASEEEQEQQGMGVVLCTHITSELDQIGDYILLLEDGALLANGERDELFAKHQVRNTKELILKLTGKEEGLVFEEQEAEKGSESTVRGGQLNQSGKMSAPRLVHGGEPPLNTGGLRQCEEFIYKHAIAGRIGSGWSFIVYLSLITLNSFFMIYYSLENKVLPCIPGICISILCTQYLSHHVEHWDDQLKQSIPWLPVTFADVKACLREQTKRMLVFWLVVQTVLVVLIGLCGMIKNGQPPLEWMLFLLLAAVILPLYAAHYWMLGFKNNRRKQMVEFLVLMIALCILIFL